MSDLHALRAFAPFTIAGLLLMLTFTPVMTTFGLTVAIIAAVILGSVGCISTAIALLLTPDTTVK